MKPEDDSNDITDNPRDDKSRPFLCTVCDKWYTRKHILVKHMNIHTGKYKCTECGKRWQSNAELTVHSRIHSGEKPFECSVCSKRFTRAGHLVNHSRIHRQEKLFKCYVCEKAFSQLVNLNSHIRVHTGLKPYSSPLMPVLADSAQPTGRSALSVARTTTSATGALQRPDHVCGTRYHST